MGAVNLYICYTLDRWSRDLNTDFTLAICLFGSVKLTKNTDLDKYKYTSIWFSLRIFIYRWKLWKNAIIFGADISSSGHVENEWKDMLIPGEGPTQGLDDTTLIAEAKYPINFTQPNRRLY